VLGRSRQAVIEVAGCHAVGSQERRCIVRRFSGLSVKKAIIMMRSSRPPQVAGDPRSRCRIFGLLRRQRVKYFRGAAVTRANWGWGGGAETRQMKRASSDRPLLCLHLPHSHTKPSSNLILSSLASRKGLCCSLRTHALSYVDWEIPRGPLSRPARYDGSTSPMNNLLH